MSALAGALAAAGPLAAGWSLHGMWLRRRLDQARRDPLTGLHTRAAFEKTTARLLRSGPTGLLVVDLDSFKALNDQYGHAAGDAAIRDRAEWMTRWLALFSPTAGLVARIGGDEFALCLPATTCQSQFALDALYAGMLAPVEHDGQRLRVGVSIGVATAGAGEDYSTVLRRADEAMYTAKRTCSGIRTAAVNDARATVAGRRAGRNGTHTP